jgi:hypothetical protein
MRDQLAAEAVPLVYTIDNWNNIVLPFRTDRAVNVPLFSLFKLVPVTAACGRVPGSSPWMSAAIRDVDKPSQRPCSWVFRGCTT